MPIALDNNTALLLIDIQQGLDDSPLKRNNPDFEKQITALLATWRAAGKPIFHVQHHSTEPQSKLRPELPGHAFKPEALPQGDEPVIGKNVNSAFIGTDLEARLRSAGIDSLVIVGLTTDHCVSTSVRMASNLGFRVYLPEDAVATYERNGYDGTHYSAEMIHNIELASLNGEFATVTDTAAIMKAMGTGQIV